MPPQYTKFLQLTLDTVTLSQCDPGTVGLDDVVASDEVGIALTFCGTFSDPCPGDEPIVPPPPALSLSPPPVMASPDMSPMMGGGLPFPCGTVPPCEDGKQKPIVLCSALLHLSPPLPVLRMCARIHSR